uniref:Putative conserved secreted protein n=1 Tax=Amblyomma parvum TaxID=251391 RepID=A0A023FXY5_AMBPA
MSLPLPILTTVLAWLSLCLASQTPQAAETEPPLLEKYDYIIVGAGSAGSVMANRLSKENKYSVLLLEAGDEMTPELFVPFMAPFSANENNSWGYETEPQRYALWSFPGYKGPITQGKVMGGTSSLNSMNYVRGNHRDFDKWETEYGAKGWKFRDVLPHFKAIENFTVPNVTQEEIREYHGVQGETPVNYPSYHTAVSNAFLEACNEAKYEYVDYNGAKESGYSRVQANTAGGIRMGADTCFLKFWLPYLKKLHISKKSIVTEILINDKNEATGVKFLKEGTEKVVQVMREVILCAGAIGSPKLLMLSGVGPRDHLEKLGIKVKVELPVGEHLQDHFVFAGIVVKTKDDLIGLRNINQSIVEYNRSRTGLLTIPGAFEAVLFTHSGVGEVENDYPDIETELAAVFPNEKIASSPYVTEDIYKEYYQPMLNYNGFMCAVALVQPESRGFMRLNSANPMDRPRIHPNFLDIATHDLSRIVNGTMKVLQLFKTEAMRKIEAELWPLPFPRCKQFEPWTEPYVTCLIQHTAFPGQHVCCTCPMGTGERAVVDENLRVRGVKYLRVVDSSVMPTIIAGNTNAAVMMTANKGAEMILKDADNMVH